MSDDRDLLIEMHSDLKHVREKVDHLATSDIKQWEKLDAQGIKVAEHDSTLSILGKGFWVGISGLVTLAIAWVKGDK